MSALEHEIASQPQMWRTAAAMAAEAHEVLPLAGARIAVVGCGTSWFMAQSVAALREAAGLGETDAFTPTEMPPGRRYDAVVVISRSGTTTEIVRSLHAAPTQVRRILEFAVRVKYAHKVIRLSVVVRLKSVRGGGERSRGIRSGNADDSHAAVRRGSHPNAHTLLVATQVGAPKQLAGRVVLRHERRLRAAWRRGRLVGIQYGQV